MKKPEKTRGSRRHTQYFSDDGTLLPGITTITGMLDKPALVVAANRLGLEGVDSGVHWRGLATIGTAAHKLLEHRLKETDPTEDMRDFTANELERAQNSVARFTDWLKGKSFRFVDSEFQNVSEKHRYGGTGDCLCYLNNKLTYADFKTGGIYLESELQGAANAELLIENGIKVEQVVILGLPRDEDETFSERILTEWTAHFEMFLALLEAYRLRKRIEGKSQKRTTQEELAKKIGEQTNAVA